MARADAPKDTVRPVKFGIDRKEKLREYLSKELEDTLADREGLMRKCKAWVEQANSRRKRNDASARNAQIDMPLTRQRMMQNSARLLNPIFQQDMLFVAKARNPKAEDIARSVERVNDYISDQIDYRSLCNDWVEQFQTFPFGAVKTPFVFETERVIRWKELEGDPQAGIAPLDDFNQRKLDGQKVTLRQLVDGGERYFLEVDDEIPVYIGALPEIVPFEDFIIPQSAADVRSADWVSHRVWLTKPQLKAQISKGVYNKKDGDVDVIEALGEPAAERDKLIKLEDSKDDSHESSCKQYEIVETFLKYDVDGSGDPVEIIVTFERKSKVFLRCIHNFYHAYRRPFVTHDYKHVQGSLFGVPLTYILEPLHVANSAVFQQRLDAGSLANETLYGVPIGTKFESSLTNTPWRTNFIETSATKDEMFEVKLANPFPGLEGIENKLAAEADKLSSLSDYSFGQEQIDRPTASGQIQIIEESKQPQYMMLERFRAALAEVAKHVLARYKQFYPEGLQYYNMQETPEGIQMVEEFFNWPDGVIEKDVIIETKVSSASMSKNLRKQELVALLDKLLPLYDKMMEYAMAASDPMNPGAIPAVKLLNGIWVTINELLTEFEVGKKDEMNPRLVEEIQVVQQIQGVMQGMQEQIGQLGNQNQQLQIANAQLQGMQMQGPPMEGQAMPPQGIQGSMPVGGGTQGPGVAPPNGGQGGPQG